MNAIILLGGLGTRLRPLTLNVPKPMIPVMNRPLIAHQIELLKSFGIRRVILALGHKAGHFRRHLGSGKKFGVEFVYSMESSPLGTGGAIRLAGRHAKGTTFILNGDVISDFNLKELARRHSATRADVTLVLVEVEDPSAFGLVQTDTGGRIRQFIEKPSGDQFPVKTVNAGCYLFEPSALDRIPEGVAVSVERETFPLLLREGLKMESLLHRGYWVDIGTLKTYWKAHKELHQGHLPDVKKSVSRVPRGVTVQGSAVVGQTVAFSGKATLAGHVTIGEGVHIGDGVHIEDSVLLRGVRVGAGSRVVRSVLGVRSVIAPDCRVGPDWVLGDNSRLSGHSQHLSLS